LLFCLLNNKLFSGKLNSLSFRLSRYHFQAPQRSFSFLKLKKKSKQQKSIEKWDVN